ncbi:MAG: hypothetical protein V3R86_02080 [Candidatus Hydrothermarchaeaceae archaeon]
MTGSLIIEFINLGITFAIVAIGIGMLIMVKSVNTELLKAQLFLKEAFIRKIWVNSTLVGATLVIHEIAMASDRFWSIKGLSQITMTLFLVPVLLLIYTWYDLLKRTIKK